MEGKLVNKLFEKIHTEYILFMKIILKYIKKKKKKNTFMTYFSLG